MTHAKIYPFCSCRAHQYRSRFNSKTFAVVRSGGQYGTPLWLIKTTGLSLFGNGQIVNRTHGGSRSKDRVYRQAFNRLDSAAAPTCRTNRLNPQRTCQSGFESLYSTRLRPWLNRHWIETFNWTIVSIVYWQPNWRKFMKYWYPIRPGLSVSKPQIANRRI